MIRRLSFVPNKKYKPSADPDPSTLAAFLKSSKAKYITDVGAHKGHDWTVVMGNEAGDLDTIASSVAYSWIESVIHNRPTIPLIQTKRTDFNLRAENIHALTLAGLDAHSGLGFDELLSVDDFQWSTNVFPSNRLALVDHNRLPLHFLNGNPGTRILAVIDHHDDEGLYKDTASPRVIQPAGSCASLLTTTLAPPHLPAELATLLLCAILVDTAGLKDGGKALQADRDAAAYLLPRSTFAPSLAPKLLARIADTHRHAHNDIRDAPAVRALAADLLAKKAAVAHLTAYDLLRRDYKQYACDLPRARAKTSVQAGLSSVPLALAEWAARDDFWECARRWMAARRLAVLGVLTSFHDERAAKKKGARARHRREMLWIVSEGGAEEGDDAGEVGDPDDPWTVPHGLDADALAGRLWRGLEGCAELALEEVALEMVGARARIPPSMRARVYNQGNVHATRKTTAPLLKKIIEDTQI